MIDPKCPLKSKSRQNSRISSFFTGFFTLLITHFQISASTTQFEKHNLPVLGVKEKKSCGGRGAEEQVLAEELPAEEIQAQVIYEGLVYIAMLYDILLSNRGDTI